MCLSFKGPCETPAIPGYVQDGEYVETTKSYELDANIVKLMLDKNEQSQLEKRKENKKAKKAAKSWRCGSDSSVSVGDVVVLSLTLPLNTLLDAMFDTRYSLLQFS